MDIQIQKKKGLRKKHIPYILLGGGLLLFVVWLIFGNHASTLKVRVRDTNMATVTREMFNDYVRLTGQVQPIVVIQLAPEEGGIVKEKRVEEGAFVKEGDVIVRLSNSNLDLSILNSEAELAEKQNFLRNTRVTMEQERLNIRQEKLQVELDVKRKWRNYIQLEDLYKEGLVPKEDYLQAKENYELSKEKRDLIVERQKQDSIYRSVQVEQMEDNLENMRRNVLLIRERKENLNIKSPISGELGLLDVVLGQSVGVGQRIGQVNDLSGYKIEAQIDEHYIDRVQKDLIANFERQSVTYKLKVRKVYPEVRGGKFKTDFYFYGELPENIRTGQTYYINLELGEPTESVIVPRGSFFQKTGGNWIYVLDGDGSKAYRRPIKIGRQNPQYYEVTEGLEPGEKVLISGYEMFEDNEILVLE